MQKQSSSIRPIKSVEHYESALERASELMQMDLASNAEAADEFEVLSLLIEQYETKHYPVPPPHPIEAIKFRLEQLGKTPADLEEVLGYRSRVSEILRGKRKLTLEMIRALHEKLNIPLESLIARY